MNQERSMRVTKVTDSPKLCDKKAQAYLHKLCCKQKYLKEVLSGYNLNPEGIITFPYDGKQIILFTSVRNNNP